MRIFRTEVYYQLNGYTKECKWFEYRRDKSGPLFNDHFIWIGSLSIILSREKTYESTQEATADHQGS